VTFPAPARPPRADPPPDVRLARDIRRLTRALVAAGAATAGLGLAAAAVLTLAGGTADGVRPGLSLVVLGQAFALVGAVVVGHSLRHALAEPAGREAPRERSPHAEGVGPTPAATEASAARADRACRSAGERLTTLARWQLVALVPAVAGWTLIDPLSGWGALLGGVVAAQVAALFLLMGRRLAGSAG
jgi:hypothetical protein